MRLLLLFLRRHHVTILFIFLEIIGIILINRNHSYHQVRFASSVNSFKGALAAKFANVGNYFALKHENEALLRENVRLYNMLEQSYIEEITLEQIDTNREHKYVYLYANVLNNSVNKQYNYLTLDKGRIQGIAEDMAVIGPDGIVGTVKSVSDNFSLVISVLNRDYHPNARIKSSEYFGYIEWNGNNYQMVKLKDIPMHAPFAIGDTIVTSGYSASFPEGIPIGVITKSEIDRGIQLEFTVKLFSDFKKLNHVIIVKNFLREEQKELEETVENEE